MPWQAINRIDSQETCNRTMVVRITESYRYELSQLGIDVVLVQLCLRKEEAIHQAKRFRRKK